MHCLFEAGGLTGEMVECFVAYLAGHNRPVHGVLFSRDQELAMTFENEFQGMARIPVELTALVEARQRLKMGAWTHVSNLPRQK